MPNVPTVSVVMATHNRPRLLQHAQASIALQDHPVNEVVVVNDGGVDVCDVVTDAQQSGLPVRLVEHATNQGRSTAFNTAIQAAGGDLVAVLADDDVYRPHHLSTALAALQSLGPGRAVYTHGALVNEDAHGNVLSSEVTGNKDFDAQLLQVANVICAAPRGPRVVGRVSDGLELDEVARRDAGVRRRNCDITTLHLVSAAVART